MIQPTSLAGGRYLLVHQLGEGGMARVYRAYDQRLQVWRAVKILSPEFADKKKIAKRFEAEAQTMALLEHKNIVRVYDVGRDGANIAYIVMELVEGGCLVDWLETNGPMPPRMAVEAVMEICEGLSAAHKKGVIHRDIKPHNVLVTVEGTCRVTDFGIARVNDGENSQTKTGSVMGTWGYMAPEQRTDAKSVDVRADVYATGATLYSLLTDRMPMDLFAAERNASILEGVHEALVPILIKSTEYDKESRFTDILAFRTALMGVLESLPPIPETIEPLALSALEKRPVPDPTQFRPATKVELLSATAPPASDIHVTGNSDVTVLPSDQSVNDPTNTLLPEGDQPNAPSRPPPSAFGMTLPPEEVALTEPGSLTRQNRPVYTPGSSDKTVLRFEPDVMATGLPIPERSSVPVSSSGGGGGAGVLLGGLGLLVALFALAAVIFVLYDRPDPVRLPEPTVPVAQPPPVPQPPPVVDPQQPVVEPVPVPDAGPVPVVPKPAVPTAPVPTQPVPVAPVPVATVPVPVVPVPVPEPPPAVACSEGQPAKPNSRGTSIIFAAYPCNGGERHNKTVTVHYRPEGASGFSQLNMAPRNEGWMATVPTTTLSGAFDYYMDGWGGSYGSATSPKSYKPE